MSTAWAQDMMPKGYHEVLEDQQRYNAAYWGCRAILTNGYVDILHDRQSAHGNAVATLLTILNDGGVLKRCTALVGELFNAYDLKAGEWYVLHMDERLVVAALPRGGYLWITAFLWPERRYQHHIHFGLYPEDEPAARVAGLEGPEQHTVLDLPNVTHATAYLSGSWGCWGPADQETDGDGSLHIMVCTDTFDGGTITNLRREIMRTPDTAGRLLDWGTVTTEDHSETTFMWFYDPARDSVGLRPEED